MKTNTQTKIVLAMTVLALFASAPTAPAANVTNYESIVSLALNTTKNYTFTDTASGQSVVVAVTMTGYSPFTSPSTFQSLDSDTRVGENLGNGFSAGMGVNFAASLVSCSSGVMPGTIKFRVAGLGVRAADGAGTVNWTSSSSTVSTALNGSAEVIVALDTTNVALGYSAQVRFPDDGLMQLTDVPSPGAGLKLNATFTVTNLVDPRTNSWFTTYSTKYARIYTSDVSKTNGTAATTWSTGGTTQANPVYCGVQEVYSSSNYVYIRSSGLGSHVMGPWYLNTNHTIAFPNYPTNEHVLYKISRNPTNPATKTANGGGPIGYFVDGVAMFNSWDAYTYANGSEAQNTTGYWNRDAYVNEGASFDPNNAHQAGGQHHYHVNPPGLRYLMGDHVDFNPVSKAYTESTNAPTKHSPILGWVADGYPIYGPYGYSVSNNAASGVRRMVSGYVVRNGQFGSQNLANASVNRANLPQWAVRLYGVLSNSAAGPAVSTTYPLGRYMEDYDWLGDLGIARGPNTYDLDEYNGRWCVTPEFPAGTYAYFVCISSNGTPVFPYNIGRGYYGNPITGNATINESVVTNFLGAPNAVPVLNAPTAKNGAVTLTWSATEGGTYMVQSTTNFTTWTTNSTTSTAVLTSAGYTNNPPDNYRFYRVARTALATYDSPGTGGYTPTINTVAPGGTATRGTTVTVTITITAPPNLPPAGAPVTSVTLAGSIAGTNISYPTSGTVMATFTIPANAPTGLQNIVVQFSVPSYTVSGLTIN